MDTYEESGSHSYWPLRWLFMMTYRFSDPRRSVTHTGVRIAAVPVVANGSIIKMELSPSRANQTIREVTYEIADTDTMNVHMVLDFLEPQ
jgi:hypothetical protein